MKNAARICFVLSVVTVLVAMNNIFIGSQHRPPERLVGYAVGSMLVPLGLLIVGLVLWRKGDSSGGTPPA